VPEILDWKARLEGGRVFSRQELLATKHDQVLLRAGLLVGAQLVRVETDHPLAPVLSIKLRPGEGVRMFTRRGVGTKGGPDASVPVVEVVPDPANPESFVRMYLTGGGIVLSTEDLTVF
jgi:hypothetical protein